jgi:hypothetical protein
MNDTDTQPAPAPKAAPAKPKAAKTDPKLEAIREEIRKSSATHTQPAPREFHKRTGKFAPKE